MQITDLRCLINARGLLWKTSASTTGTKPASADAIYTYRPSAQPASRQFLGGPVVPMTYTIREQLAKIGDPARTTSPFSAGYTYHPNGTVAESDFYNAGTPATAKRYRYVFGTGSYDALNRLTSADFSSWSGSGWTSTLAHDLTGITYDASGNLTALTRRRETGTVLDQLTYGSASTSNRLLSVTEAAGVSAEAWDAEGGTFTYDANGNLLAAPAPYTVSAVTYDPRNLPLTVTRAGVTSAYRYDASGQRITKQVGGGATEVYVLDGATSLGVVTLDAAGSPTGWAFNVLAGDRVIGRQPHTGARRHCHTDLLGSTRAVVAGTTILESTDYDPWGVVLAGRSLGGGTKEGFTGKERDAESGLDAFGARQYLSAFGRWGSVDPLAELYPAWSPYNYVENNPAQLFDPDGRSSCCVVPAIHSAIGPRMAAAIKFEIVKALWPELEARFYEGVRDIGSLMAVAGGIQGLGAGLFPAARATVSTTGAVTHRARAGTSATPQYPAGSFSITEQGFRNYPRGVPRPQGPLRLLDGDEYNAARTSANRSNSLIRREQRLVGQPVDIHEIQPVKFGKSPTDPSNKVILDRTLHREQVTPWWNLLQRDLKPGGGGT